MGKSAQTGRSNKIVVITGGGRGIGAACAELFAASGYDVVIAGRTLDELITTKNRLQRQFPDRLITEKQADVSKPADVKALFAHCTATLGNPTVLINNAAIIKVQSIFDVTLSDWEETQAINVRGTMLCCQAAFALMRHTGGSIVNISSLAGVANVEKFSGFSSYCASKAAVVGLSQCLAVEGLPHGIRVNCIAPGAVNTRMLSQAAPGLVAKAEAHDLAKTIFTLADDEFSRHVTGALWEVFTNG